MKEMENKYDEIEKRLFEDAQSDEVFKHNERGIFALMACSNRNTQSSILNVSHEMLVNMIASALIDDPSLGLPISQGLAIAQQELMKRQELMNKKPKTEA